MRGGAYGAIFGPASTLCRGILPIEQGLSPGGAAMNEQTPSAEALMIEDLSRRVAQANLEAAEWKARALLAEHALKEIKEAADPEEDAD